MSTFRPMLSEDYPVVLEILNEWKPTNISKPQFDDFLSCKGPNHSTFVLQVGSEIVGFATVLLELKLIHDGAYVAHIEDVCVARKHQRQRYGQVLVEFLVQYAKSKNCYKVILNCHPALISFYEKNGFCHRNVEMSLYFDSKN